MPAWPIAQRYTLYLLRTTSEYGVARDDPNFHLIWTDVHGREDSRTSDNLKCDWDGRHHSTRSTMYRYKIFKSWGQLSRVDRESVWNVRVSGVRFMDTSSETYQKGGKVHRIVLIDPHNPLDPQYGIGMRIDTMLCDPGDCTTWKPANSPSESSTIAIPNSAPFVDHMGVVVMFTDTG
ncbi:hypothetical protein LTR95_000625 [Oleoguttula sp. CCFEE 5521]